MLQPKGLDQRWSTLQVTSTASFVPVAHRYRDRTLATYTMPDIMATRCAISPSHFIRQDSELALKEFVLAQQTPEMTEELKLAELPHWFNGTTVEQLWPKSH